MYILGFETTGPICSVALLDLDNPNRIFIVNGKEPMSHLKDLTRYAKILMEDEGVAMDGIAAVAASIGPGSFTGIRIGVTSARAVAQALNVPCIAVPTLDVFRLRSDRKSVVVPIFNARRGQVYGAIFSETKDVLAPGPYMLEDVLAELKGYMVGKCSAGCAAESLCVVFYGDGVDAYMERLIEFKEASDFDIEFAPEEARYQTADLVIQYAADKSAKSETCAVEELLPDYMRKAEAEQKLEDGTLKKLREEKLARLMAGN